MSECESVVATDAQVPLTPAGASVVSLCEEEESQELKRTLSSAAGRVVCAPERDIAPVERKAPSGGKREFTPYRYSARCLRSHNSGRLLV